MIHEATLEAATEAVFAVAFRPDGRALLAGGSDAALHVWASDPEAAVAYVCGEAGTPITRKEWAEYAQGAPYRPPAGDIAVPAGPPLISVQTRTRKPLRPAPGRGGFGGARGS